MSRWSAFICVVLTAGLGGAQDSKTQTETSVLVGVVVRYDARLRTRTSQDDLILRVVTESVRTYARIRYDAHGWAFDAPAAQPNQMVPKGLSFDQVVWAFTVHRPRNRTEASACGTEQRAWAPGPNGQMIEIKRYTSVGGREGEQVPDWRTLPCYIVDRWEQRTDAPPVSK